MRPSTSPICCAALERPWTVPVRLSRLRHRVLRHRRRLRDLAADLHDRCRQLLGGGGRGLHTPVCLHRSGGGAPRAFLGVRRDVRRRARRLMHLARGRRGSLGHHFDLGLELVGELQLPGDVVPDRHGADISALGVANGDDGEIEDGVAERRVHSYRHARRVLHIGHASGQHRERGGRAIALGSSPRLRRGRPRAARCRSGSRS